MKSFKIIQIKVTRRFFGAHCFLSKKSPNQSGRKKPTLITQIKYPIDNFFIVTDIQNLMSLFRKFLPKSQKIKCPKYNTLFIVTQNDLIDEII